MREFAPKSFTLSIAGHGVCVPDEETAACYSLANYELELSMLAPMIRRRTSLATRIAISAATRACQQAGLGSKLPAIFMSSRGEIQTTNMICRAIAEEQYPLSPTLFHNSVHNTAAGYWSIAAQSTEPMQAMAALHDCFLLGLLEAWTQITAGFGSILLVLYDEDMPPELMPDYTWQPCATALILNPHVENQTSLTVPIVSTEPASTKCLEIFKAQNHVAVTLPLIRLLQQGKTGAFEVPVDPCNPQLSARLVLK